MEIVKHRVNSIAELIQIHPECGVEVDIRSYNSKLILQHEPNLLGESFEDYVSTFARLKFSGIFILNVKEDGIEKEVLRILSTHSVTNFFFLDLTTPTLVRLCIKDKMSKIAVRVSEYETLESALMFKGVADWVWLDCFSGRPFSKDWIYKLKKYFKVCLVSPELQGYPPERIGEFKNLASIVNAVCTKHEKLWA